MFLHKDRTKVNKQEFNLKKSSESFCDSCEMNIWKSGKDCNQKNASLKGK